ncbi:hypothetical protein DPMN_172542 [Dreissena polymorpha]|uniref:Uncharacterized protein n=1 Tax=Dreissena polymorpha TaxID=45954 RepID=A0A9D4E194_DREPO|nr:hypothetical protein DPMN_172542 [Dreissena polymorpha]
MTSSLEDRLVIVTRSVRARWTACITAKGSDGRARRTRAPCIDVARTGSLRLRSSCVRLKASVNPRTPRGRSRVTRSSVCLCWGMFTTPYMKLDAQTQKASAMQLARGLRMRVT